MDNPIMVKSFGDEQYCGCTGCPADSHITIWLTVHLPCPLLPPPNPYTNLTLAHRCPATALSSDAPNAAASTRWNTLDQLKTPIHTITATTTTTVMGCISLKSRRRLRIMSSRNIDRAMRVRV